MSAELVAVEDERTIADRSADRLMLSVSRCIRVRLTGGHPSVRRATVVVRPIERRHIAGSRLASRGPRRHNRESAALAERTVSGIV